MNDYPTCGKGLASHAVLPVTLGALTAAVAEILEAHMPSLDLTDERSRQEHAAYLQLATAHRQAAAQLGSIGREMEGYRDLPMGRHDMEAMGAPAVRESFRKFVELEEELLALLEQRLVGDRRMLKDMEATD